MAGDGPPAAPPPASHSSRLKLSVVSSGKTCGPAPPAVSQAATLYAAASCGRRAASSGSDGSSNGSAGSSDPGREWVGRSYGSQLGKPVPVRPELAAELRSLAVLAGVADTAKLSRNVAALGPKPERRVVEHGAAVVQLLLSLGVPKAQLATLLERCPLLFSRPAEQRVALLFGQLAQLGLTAVEAARCFEQQPTAANVRSFEPAIAVLAELFAASSKAGGSRSGEQLLGDLLRQQPAAVGLLCTQPTILQQRISNLVQRYGPHWEQQNKQAVIVAAMQQQSWTLPFRPAAHLLAQEAVLQQELGQQPGDGTHLLATILQRHALAASCSPDTLQARVQALKAVSWVVEWLFALCSQQGFRGIRHASSALMWHPPALIVLPLSLAGVWAGPPVASWTRVSCRAASRRHRHLAAGTGGVAAAGCG